MSNLTNKKKLNPFQHRWRLDDPEFVRQRKSYWPHIKVHLENSGCKPDELKLHKAYFMEGEKSHHGIPSVSDMIAWAPSSNYEEMQELVEWLATSPDVADSQAVWKLNFLALVGKAFKNPRSPISPALGKERLIAKVVLGSAYKEESFRTLLRGKSVPKFVSPELLISEFELRAFHELMSPDPNLYSPTIYNIDFYLSCIRYLESKGEYSPDRSGIVLKDFSALISAVFHFVEPGQTADKPPSAMAELAARLREMFLREDAPEYIRREMAKMGESKLVEYKKEEGSNEQVYRLDQLMPRGAMDAGRFPPEVLRGCDHAVALNAFCEAWIENGLLPKGFDLPQPVLVDLAQLLSREVVKELGYPKGEAVPAWKINVWYTPSFTFSNSSQAQFGCDLYFIIPSTHVDPKNVTSLLYFPRISEYYLDYFPSHVVLLKSRQIKRALFEKTGHHLLRYTDNSWCQELGDLYTENAELNLGFSVFAEHNCFLTTTAVSGLNAPLLNATQVVVKAWNEILKNVD